MSLHPDDREDLKQSVARVIAEKGIKNKVKRRFKHKVGRAISHKSKLTDNAVRSQIGEAHDLIDELWDEIRKERMH